MAAGPLVDRADVQAGAAADAVERLAADRVGQHLGAAVVEQDEVELLRAVARGDARSRTRCTGSSARPVLERGRSWRKTSKSCQVGTTFSMPMTEIRTLGQGQAHPAVALGLDDADRAGLGDAEVGPADRRPARSGTSAAGASRAAAARAFGSSVRPSVSSSRRRKRSRISARFLWIAGTRMCDDRSPASWMISSARSVSIASMPTCARASFRPISSVVSDLILTTSFAPWPATIPAMIRLASAASRAQWTCPPARVTDVFELDQVVVEVPERPLLDRPAGLAEGLPVGQLVDDRRPLAADRLGGLAHVAAELRVAQGKPGRVLERDGRARSAAARSSRDINSAFVVGLWSKTRT